MNKKTIMIILGIIVVTAILVGFGLIHCYGVLKNKEDNKDNTSVSGKTLIVYFSAQNHTRNVATKLAEYLNADTFEVVPKEIYTEDDLDWTNKNSRVSKEHDDEALRDIELVSTKVENWEEYDTVLIGYPIWWQISSWAINDFVKENNFDGKTVIPFCTSSSSGLGESAKLLEELAGSGNWQEGHRFSSSASDSDIKAWAESLKK